MGRGDLNLHMQRVRLEHRGMSRLTPQAGAALGGQDGLALDQVVGRERNPMIVELFPLPESPKWLAYGIGHVDARDTIRDLPLMSRTKRFRRKMSEQKSVQVAPKCMHAWLPHACKRTASPAQSRQSRTDCQY